MKFLSKKIEQGFTLIELLIVIAVIGVLAAMVLIAINPLEQLARGRDAGRKSAVGQLGAAVQAFYTSRSAFPVAAATWGTDLVSAGEIRSIPGGSNYTAGPTACGTNAIGSTFPQWCYNTYLVGTVTQALVYARMESAAENSRCTLPALAWFVFSAEASRGGLVCLAAEPAGTVTFLP